MKFLTPKIENVKARRFEALEFHICFKNGFNLPCFLTVSPTLS